LTLPMGLCLRSCTAAHPLIVHRALDIKCIGLHAMNGCLMSLR